MAVKHALRAPLNNKRNEIYAFDLTGNETLPELITKLKNGAYADRALNQVVGDGAAMLGDSVDKVELDKMLAAEGLTTGTSTAYLLTQPNFFLIDGATIRLYLHVMPGLAATLNVNNTGAKALDIPQGFPVGWYTLTYHNTTGKYVPVGVGTQYRQNFNIAAGTPVTTIDLVVLPYSRYKFLEHPTEQVALTTLITVARPNQGYIRYGGEILDK